MRLIRIEHVQEGMRVARNVQDANGGVLITANTVLKDVHIRKLKSFGYAGVYIDDEISKDLEIDDLICFETQLRAIECIKNKDFEGCSAIADQMIKEIEEHQELSLDITDLRAMDDCIYSHSVNVAIYSCIIGIGMGFKYGVLSKLVLAALIHDIGKTAIPKEILNKQTRLSPYEYNVMKQHAEQSFAMIQNVNGISEYVKDAVLHHHENEDGSGYPDKMEGKNQSIYTKILHVADVYDALVSKRPYKEPYSPSESVEYLMGACDILFDKQVVDALIRYIPLFPLGTEVELSNGKHAIIYKNNKMHNLRPVVKLFDGFMLDLAEPENSTIVVRTLGSADDLEMENSERERNRMLEGAVKPKLLVVDDMLTNLQMLRDILGDYYDAIFVKSGNQALNYLAKNKVPDLILMDIEMPDLNGIDTVRIIRQKYGQVPVMFVTARRDKDTVLLCKQMHMSGYIIKPYQATFVRAEVERILEENM